MAHVRLSEGQAAIMRALDLPESPSTDASDAEWFAILDRVAEELQRHGINDAGDGLNAHGEECRRILEAMAEAEG
jgi:hypothetical protein